jgi:hypothetical protein
MPVKLSNPLFDSSYQVFIPCAVAWRLVAKFSAQGRVSTWSSLATSQVEGLTGGSPTDAAHTNPNRANQGKELPPDVFDMGRTPFWWFSKA